MNNINNDILIKILHNIEIKTKIKYLQIGNDGEQTKTIFYQDNLPYCLVSKYWNFFFHEKNKKNFNNFFKLF